MITKQAIINILSDPDFMNRVNHLKKSPMYQGCSDEFIKVVQLVFELYIGECEKRWKQERVYSLKHKKKPYFHSYSSFKIKTSQGTTFYMPRLIRVLTPMFNLSKAEWDKLKEVFSIPPMERSDPFVHTHGNMNDYVAKIISPDLIHPDEDDLIVVSSTLGVSVFDKQIVALGKQILASLKP